MAKFDVVIAAKTVGEQGIKRLGNSMQGVHGKVKNLKLAVTGLNGALKIFAGVLAAGAFTRFIKGAIDQADAFGKMSVQTGIAANTLQSYVNAGKLAGIEQATIDKGLRRLSQSMREADQGVATYKDSFDALGLTVRNTDGTFKTNQQVLGEIADRFADMPDGATKAAIAMEIFGRSGASMINLLNGGKVALEEFNYEVSDNFSQNAEYFNDQIQILKIRFDGFRKQLADALLPTLNKIVEIFSDVFKSGNNFEKFFKFIEGGIRGIAIVVFATGKLIEEIGNFGTKVVQKIGEAFNWIRDNTPKWLLKFITGGVDIGKDLGKRFIKQQELNFRGLMGDEYVDDFKKRFGSNIGTLGDLTSGTSKADDSYGIQKTGLDAEETGNKLDKTFGQQMVEKIDKFKNSIKSVGESLVDVGLNAIKSLEDNLVDFIITGTFKFREFASNIIKELARIAVQQTITAPLTGWFKGLFSAKGNVLENGQHLTAYAKGGVIDKPHFKYMANGGIAVAGEKSAEAILPLKRGADGNLGVISQGGGGNVVNVTVNAENSNVEGDNEKSQRLGQAIAAAVQAEIVNQQRAGGLLYN